jgi:hypothetical protein
VIFGLKARNFDILKIAYLFFIIYNKNLAPLIFLSFPGNNPAYPTT